MITTIIIIKKPKIKRNKRTSIKFELVVENKGLNAMIGTTNRSLE